MVILLILIIGTVTGYDLKCPAKAEWRLRANISCYSESKYVCLFHLLEGEYEESCLGSDRSSIGSKLVFQPLFNLAICNADRYQPVVFTTHGNSDCILRKSECAGEGQVVYSNESSSKDITCHCDYTKGYTFVSRPKNTCFCKPSTEDCSCFRVKCSNLSSDYQCITNGNIKAKTQCPEIHQQVSLNKDNLTVQVIDSNTHSDIISIAIIVITALKCYVFVPPKMFPPKTITYDEGGKTTVLKCYVRSYLPLKSAMWCRLLPNNECLDKKSSMASNGKGLRTIIYETSEELESAIYKCKASNIIGAVESPPIQLHENEKDEPLLSSIASSSTTEDLQKDIHELFQNEECGKHYFARVIFIGKNGVGKTSLMRRLLWGTKEQSSSTQSTDGIDIKKCNINIKDGSWSPCNKVDHDLARLIQQVYTDKKENGNEDLEQNIEHSFFGERNSSSSSGDSKAGFNQAFVPQEKLTHDHKTEVSTQSSHDKTDQDQVFTDDSSDVDDIKGENTNCIIDTSEENVKTMDDCQEKGKQDQLKRFENNLTKTNEVENDRGIQNDESIVQMTNSIMQSCLYRDANDSHNMLAFCALWDFAGQKDFYATHQVFLSKCAVFLLVTDSLEFSCAEKLWIDFQKTA
ncbi:Hypothetical predicted protein, partial [Mytilus galloprovincialis]